MMGALLTLAALSNTTLVLPDVACPLTPEEMGGWAAASDGSLNERLARVPHRKFM